MQPGDRPRHRRGLVRQHRHRASGLTVDTDQFGFGVTWAEWLVKKLNGQGNVIMVTGVAGTYDDEERNKGADERLGQEAGHQGGRPLYRHVGFGRPSQTNTAAILPTLPQIDGIWCQSGTDGVLKAFVERQPQAAAAHRRRPAENGFRKFMMGYMDQRSTASRSTTRRSVGGRRSSWRGASCAAPIRARTSWSRRRR